MANLKKLVETSNGRIILSIIFGLGLSTMFRKACNKRNCIVFKAPHINDIKGKTFKFQDKCYQFTEEASKCDSNKKIVSFT
jgi:hypothetical protein